MRDQVFSEWFEQGTGFSPRDWQGALARDQTCRDRLIRIPTGFGKTLGVVGAWAYHRLHRQDPEWPTRLVITLPMRVLVEQTLGEVRALLERCGIPMAGACIDGDPTGVAVHGLMGGVAAESWHLCPEQPAVLVGTQDMLLSRALNRGYASPRPRWPMEYGLLNQDTLWVMDEVQLMGVGLTTSYQLQGFRRLGRELKPSATWWMSATLQPAWLRHGAEQADVLRLSDESIRIPAEARYGGLFEVTKSLALESVPKADDAKCVSWASLVYRAHQEQSETEHGRITLAVCNTVDDAGLVFAGLEKLTKGAGTELQLVHSRFRGVEKAYWAKTFLHRKACGPNADRIIVATQVVEAGVDISAGTLITQLAPWASMVQRFGRCARYGGAGRVLVVDRGLGDKQCAPYAPDELQAALGALHELVDVGSTTLESFEEQLLETDPNRLPELYPFEPLHVLKQRDIEELFDTEGDLSGDDLDVSRFIREGDERDLSVFWWPIEDKHDPVPELQPTRDGLCPVPVTRARKWLLDGSKLKDGTRAWSWDYVDGVWKRLRGTELRPGQLLLVDAATGGYDTAKGFTGKRGKSAESIPLDGTTAPLTADQRSELGPEHEELSRFPYKTIATHGAEVAEQARWLSKKLGFGDHVQELLELAGVLHDAGKSHPAFVHACRPEARTPNLRDRLDLAKAPPEVWGSGAGLFVDDDGHPRRGFRHELASTLMLFEWLRGVMPRHAALLGPYQELVEMNVLEPPSEEGSASKPGHELARLLTGLSAEDFNLVAYLVCSHHGKVRGSWSASPQDQEATARRPEVAPIRGLLDRDTTPSLALSFGGGVAELQPATRLSLDAARLGLSGRYGQSWRERVTGLRRAWGPAALALLETCLRVADVRASRLDTADPLLQQEASR